MKFLQAASASQPFTEGEDHWQVSPILRAAQEIGAMEPDGEGLIRGKTPRSVVTIACNVTQLCQRGWRGALPKCENLLLAPSTFFLQDPANVKPMRSDGLKSQRGLSFFRIGTGRNCAPSSQTCSLSKSSHGVKGKTSSTPGEQLHSIRVYLVGSPSLLTEPYSRGKIGRRLQVLGHRRYT